MRTLWWIKHPILAIKVFCRSIGRLGAWFPVIWTDCDFDWNWIYRILEFKLRRLARDLEHGNCVNNRKYAKEAAIAAALCKRIHEDRYWEFEPTIGPLRRHRKLKVKKGSGDLYRQWYEGYMLHQDLDYLHRFLTKKVQCWWD